MPDIRRMYPVALMNEAFSMTTGDVIFPISDDIVFNHDTIRTGYKYLVDNFEDYDGIVGIKQQGLDNTTGLLMIGKKFLDRFPNRKAFCPAYKSLYCDTEIANYAKKLGKFKFCASAVALHRHPVLDKKYMDETHNVCRIPQKQDIENWDRRQGKGLVWGESFEL